MIKKIRNEIDKIDLRILDLLNKRAKLVLDISKIKKQTSQKIFSPTREKSIISNLIRRNKGPLKNENIENIFSEIINSCRTLQKKLKIAYLGPEATFTHLAAMKKFGKYSEYISLRSIPDVFYGVEKNIADYGVVPIENSTEGVINHTLDMFIESNLQICGEINLPIHHCLVSKQKNLKKIKKVFSHPQAFAQCRNFLETYLPNAELIEMYSTSEAALMAKKYKYSAAITSPLAASIYNLNVIAEKIEDSVENYTRFLIIGKDTVEKSGDDKTSILFSIKDRVGALHDMLKPFKDNNINLTMIESRPVKGKPWQYVFFLDFLGHVTDPNVSKALSRLKKMAIFVKQLGSYPRAD